MNGVCANQFGDRRAVGIKQLLKLIVTMSGQFNYAAHDITVAATLALPKSSIGF
jgi:hypothetical protein